MFDRKTDNGKSYYSSDFTPSSWKCVNFIEFYKKLAQNDWKIREGSSPMKYVSLIKSINTTFIRTTSTVTVGKEGMKRIHVYPYFVSNSTTSSMTFPINDESEDFPSMLTLSPCNKRIELQYCLCQGKAVYPITTRNGRIVYWEENIVTCNTVMKHNPKYHNYPSTNLAQLVIIAMYSV